MVEVYSLSGTFANVGDLLNKGTVMAFEHYKTAAGKQINYTLLDDQGDAGRSSRCSTIVQCIAGRPRSMPRQNQDS